MTETITEGATLSAPRLPRATVGKPTTTHQTFWNQIDDRIMAALNRYLPQIGTVIGADGGNVQVTLDDEADDRTVGLPRRKGVRYQNGDRVKVSTLRGGDKMVDGIVSTRTGRDPAVDSEDIYAGGVKTVNLASRSVTAAELGLGSVTYDHLASDSKQQITNALNAGNLGQTLASNAQGTANTAITNAASARSRADNAFTNAGTAQTAANAAQSSANAANTGLGNILNNDLPAAKARLAKLEQAAHDAGWSGF